MRLWKNVGEVVKDILDCDFWRFVCGSNVGGMGVGFLVGIGR